MTAAARKAQYEEAKEAARLRMKGVWLSMKDLNPLDEFFYRRSFAVQIITYNIDLRTHAAEFLGRAAVDRNAFTPKQKEWFSRLIEEYVGIDAPKPEPKSKKKTEAGK